MLNNFLNKDRVIFNLESEGLKHSFIPIKINSQNWLLASNGYHNSGYYFVNLNKVQKIEVSTDINDQFVRNSESKKYQNMIDKFINSNIDDLIKSYIGYHISINESAHNLFIMYDNNYCYFDDYYHASNKTILFNKEYIYTFGISAHKKCDQDYLIERQADILGLNKFI